MIQDPVEIASRFTLDIPSRNFQLLKSHLLNVRRTASVPVVTDRADVHTNVFAAYRSTAIRAK